MGIPFRSPIIGEVPSNLKQRLDYTGGPSATDPVYIGYAVLGTAETSTGWLIRKLTYSGSAVTEINIAVNAIWANRASITFN